MISQQSAGAHTPHMGQLWTNEKGEIVRATIYAPGGKKQVFVNPGQLVEAQEIAAEERAIEADSIKPTTEHVNHVAAAELRQMQLYTPPNGFQRILGETVDFEAYNRFYPGRTPDNVIFEKGFTTAVQELRVNGVVQGNSVSLVLWVGATRAMQVARWARREQEKRDGTPRAVRNLGNLIADSLLAGPPQARKVAS